MIRGGRCSFQARGHVVPWHSRFRLSLIFLLTIQLISHINHTQARIHELTIKDDSRSVFNIETFGLVEGGVIELKIKAFHLTGKEEGSADVTANGFIIRRANSLSDALSTAELLAASGKCIRTASHKDVFDKHGDFDACALQMEGSEQYEVDDAIECNYRVLSPPATGGKSRSEQFEVKLEVPRGREGRYQLLFQRCSPEASAESFQVEATFYNPGPNYLSAGEQSLPTLFFLTSLVYAALIIGWISLCRKYRENVHHIHIIMTVLLVCKALSLFFEALSLSAIANLGRAIGWNVLFYIFYFVKGMLFFVVIMLIGTGWSFVKPFLNDQEKQIMMVVLPLQV